MEVVVKINGGLGNQLFQYATGRSLADRTGAELFLDLSFFDLPPGAHTARPFELDVFKPRYTRADADHFAPYYRIRDNSWLLRLNRAFPTMQQRRWISERSFRFDPAVLTLKGNIYLDGHWQSERYFIDHEQELRRDLQFAEALSSADQDLVERMNGSTAVSLHVRRGDYVTHAAANTFHGLCGPDYYARAMAFVLERQADATFFIFSDDLPWAKENLPALAPMVFVEHDQQQRDHRDMQLMTHGRHHIIANSSFSWWGAWLNPHPDKLVVAPQRWFADASVDTRDLIPHNWHRL